MKAAYIRAHGGPERLEWGELPTPEPVAGEVRIKVRACGINHLDLWVRKGLPNLNLPFPHVLGSDIAGVVDKVGPHTQTPFAVGAEVVVHPAYGCGGCPACHRGDDNLCPRYKILGEQTTGGNSEFFVAKATHLFPKPSGLSFETAAAVPLVFLTAWQMVVRKANVQPGEFVLIHAAGSGVSTAAIQIARRRGARVIAVAGSAEKLKRAGELGAEFLINRATEDWIDRVKSIAARGVPVILDHSGEEMWEKNIRLLTWGGRLVICGATSGPQAKTDLRHLFFRQLSLLGSTMGRLGDMDEILAEIERGHFTPVLDRTYPIEEIAAAHRRLEDRAAIGKVVLTLE